MDTNFSILPLYKRPEFAEVCAAWSFGEWGCQIKNGRGLLEIFSDYKDSIKDNQLPLTWVAIHKTKNPIGMVRLKKNDHADKPDLTPWLGTLFVHPKFRGQGVASALCKHAEKTAKDMGYAQIYLFTGSSEDMYRKRGYTVIEYVEDSMGFQLKGEPLMMKTL